jgi:hypothetical protein
VRRSVCCGFIFPRRRVSVIAITGSVTEVEAPSANVVSTIIYFEHSLRIFLSGDTVGMGIHFISSLTNSVAHSAHIHDRMPLYARRKARRCL